MTYQEQIKSPKWQKKRLEILDLRGFKCEKCSCEEKQLHVHHRFYLKGRKAWEYDNDVFQVLCHSCHENEHKKEDNINFEIEKKWIRFINQFEKNHSEHFDDLRYLFHGIDTKCNKSDIIILTNVLNSEMATDLMNIAHRFNELNSLLCKKNN